MFKNFLTGNGIIHQKKNSYTPHQNGISERINRTLVEKACCLLFDAGLEKCFWAEAVNTAVYLRNRSMATGLQKTPYEVWSKKKPDVSNLKIFGSEVMMLIPEEKRRKFDKKSRKMILIGFSENVKGYRLFDPITKSIVISRDVIVNEKPFKSSEIFYSSLIDDSCEETPVSVGDMSEDSSVEQSQVFSDSSDEYNPEEDLLDSDASSSYHNTITESIDEQDIRRSDRQRKPTKFEDYVTYTCQTDVSIEDVPLSVSDALSRPDSDK